MIIFNILICVQIFLLGLCLVPSGVKTQICGKSSTPGISERFSSEEDDDAEDEAKPGQFSWMGVIMKRSTRRKREEFICNGFLIDKQHALTAAHCFGENNPTKYTLKVGDINYQKAESYEIASISIPSTYEKSKHKDDIAVVKLARPVKDPNVSPICLPTKSEEKVLTGVGTVTGWNRIEPTGHVSKKLMYSPSNRIVSTKVCRRAEPLFRSPGVPKKFLCVEYFGDEERCKHFFSGSPFMISKNSRWYAVGFVIFGITKCNSPVGYTRISDYSDFIKKHTS